MRIIAIKETEEKTVYCLKNVFRRMIRKKIIFVIYKKDFVSDIQITHKTS